MDWHIVIVYVQKYIFDSVASYMPYRYNMVDTFYMNTRRWQRHGAYHVYERYCNSTGWILGAQISANSAKLTCLVAQ